MKKNNILFAHIVEHIPGSVIVTSFNGDIEYVNSSTEIMLGFGRNELSTMVADDIIVEVKKKGSWQYIHDFFLKDKNNTYQEEVHFVCKDTRTVSCYTHAFCIFDKTNVVEAIVLVFRDITNERMVAEELESKHIEMARMNSELIRSNQELKRVSELKTKFLSIASHELKTPLTSIKGYSEIILDGMEDRVDKGVYRMIGSVNRAADRLHDVINNMLDVTRIEQKRLRLKPENMKLHDSVEECIDELSQFTMRRNIVFKCDFQNDIPSFYGDKMRIHQVFTNLFSNALKYSPDNSEITVKIYIDKEKRFHIKVIDNGIGINRVELEKIFDPFYEVASTSRHSTDAVKFMGGGTGLGLSIVKGVVERHGGVIWAESTGCDAEKFPGSIFHILFPVETRIQWDDDETQIIKLNKIIKPPARKAVFPIDVKPTILIIDDDREAIEITRMVLQKNFDIITADTGEEGLGIAFKELPALILLDLYLPGMDGTQICRILRSQVETKDISIAFFTAATQSDEIEKCYASGADEFIVKPFNGKDMVEKVTRLFSLRNQNEEVDEEY